jgi:hypothetical protein
MEKGQIVRIQTQAGAWIDDENATDNDLRYSARQQINAWRDDQRDAGFEAIGRKWDSDSNSRDNLTAVVISGQGSPTGTWTSADDEDVPVTADTMLQLYSAMLIKGGMIHARQRAMKAGIVIMDRNELLKFSPGW